MKKLFVFLLTMQAFSANAAPDYNAFCKGIGGTVGKDDEAHLCYIGIRNKEYAVPAEELFNDTISEIRKTIVTHFKPVKE